MNACVRVCVRGWLDESALNSASNQTIFLKVSNLRICMISMYLNFGSM